MQHGGYDGCKTHASIKRSSCIGHEHVEPRDVLLHNISRAGRHEMKRGTGKQKRYLPAGQATLGDRCPGALGPQPLDGQLHYRIDKL